MSYVHPDGTPEVRISRYLQDGRFVSREKMQLDLKISDQTVRKAVNVLVEMGVVERTYGSNGSVILAFKRKVNEETPVHRRKRLVSEAQKAIAGARQAIDALTKCLEDR